MVARGEGALRDWVKRWRDSEVTEQYKDIKDSIGNAARSTVMAMRGAQWGLETSGRWLRRVYDCVTTMLYA